MLTTPRISARRNAVNLGRFRESPRDVRFSVHDPQGAEALIRRWRERDKTLNAKADAEASQLWARGLADRAECYGRCADELEAVLSGGARPPEPADNFREALVRVRAHTSYLATTWLMMCVNCYKRVTFESERSNWSRSSTAGEY